MTKAEFLTHLDKRLQILKQNEREDILGEYAQHIELKIQTGLSEKEAIRDFGDPEELVHEILDAYHVDSEFDKGERHHPMAVIGEMGKKAGEAGRKAGRKAGGNLASLGRSIYRLICRAAATCKKGILRLVRWRPTRKAGGINGGEQTAGINGGDRAGDWNGNERTANLNVNDSAADLNVNDSAADLNGNDSAADLNVSDRAGDINGSDRSANLNGSNRVTGLNVSLRASSLNGYITETDLDRGTADNDTGRGGKGSGSWLRLRLRRRDKIRKRGDRDMKTAVCNVGRKFICLMKRLLVFCWKLCVAALLAPVVCGSFMVLIGIGILLVLVIMGYPLIGFLLITLGALVCGGSFVWLVWDLVFRKKREEEAV